MRLVSFAEDGAVELKWMWLPTFIGQNHPVMANLQQTWKEKFKGKLPMTEASLGILHEFTLDWLQEKFHIKGLREYLAAIANVQEV
jgi:hypothetical protein